MQDWNFIWKILFNTDPTKQTKKLIFQKKKIPGIHRSLYFNNSLIEQAPTQCHLGLMLNHKLTIQYHVNKKIKKP